MGTTHSRRLKGGLGDGRRPTDENDAEKAQGGRDCSKPAEPQTNGTTTSQPAPSPGLLARLSKALTHSRTEGEGAKPKDSDFREDARIWQLYLEKAEESANEKATLWTTGLDSLLIFAGLFAGIVAGFVIDIRSDLQPDRAPRLLSDILDFLRNVASSDTSGDTPNSVYWIHGLWIISLFTTISSAILGVLAKAWLAKYIPAKNRGTSKDAYRRYKLDSQAERLYLKEVLVLAPLLVQLASALFLAGLILQALGDVPAIGRTLLCLCLLGVLGYFLLTVFPLFIRSSPFNTPLSELLHAVYARMAGLEATPLFKPDIDDGLEEILYHNVIMSGKSALMEEVVAEVARGLKPRWIDFLCKRNTPATLLFHFQECATSRTTDPQATLQKNDVLGNYLLTLLSFTERYEERLSRLLQEETTIVGIFKQHTPNHGNLDSALRDALEPGMPLHRYNGLPQAVRPLLFALRANLLVFLPTSEPYLLTSRRAPPTDLSRNEIAERPWDMVLRGIPSNHRLHFTLAACRGLVEGEPYLRKASSFILCLSLAKASFTACETGETTELASSLTTEEQDPVPTLMLRYLSRPHGTIVSGWKDMAADALRDASSIEVPQCIEVPKLLLLSLSQPDSRMRAHAFKMLKHWIGTSTLGPESCIDRSDLVRIANMAVLNDQGMQDDILALLAELTKADSAPMVELIQSALIESICSGLKNPPARMTAIQFLVKLSTSLTKRRIFISVLAEVIPKLNDLDDLVRVGLTASHFRPTSANTSNNSIPAHLASVDTQALRNAILRYLSQMLDKGTPFHAQFLGDLTAVVEGICSAPDGEQASTLDVHSWPLQLDVEHFWAFPWDLPSDFIPEFLDHHDTANAPSMLQKLVTIAIGRASGNVSSQAGKILKLLCTRNPSYFVALNNSTPPHLSVLLPSPPTQDLGLAAKWVKLLAGMPPQLLADFRAEATISLEEIMGSVKDAVYAQKGASEASEDAPAAGRTTETKSTSLIRLLDQAGQDDRMHWIDIFSALSYIYPDHFPDAPEFLFEILWHVEKTLLVPLRVLDGLLLLGKQAAISSNLQASILSNLNRINSARDWHVRVALPQILTDLGASTKLHLEEPILDVLRRMALEDIDYDVRSEAVKFLTFLSNGSEGEDEEKNLLMFDQGIQDKEPSTRRSWLEFAVPHIKDASSPRVVTIFKQAISDTDSLVRWEASNTLRRLLSDSKRRASYASALAGFVALVFNVDPTCYTRIASLLVHLTTAQIKSHVPQGRTVTPRNPEDEGEKLYPLAEFNNTLAPGHDAWVRLVMFLGRNGFEKVSAIIEVAMKAEVGETFGNLRAAFDSLEAELLGQLRDALPKYLDSALSGPENKDRLESVNLLTSLLHDERHAYGLLGGPMDTQPQLMSRLAEASMKSDETRLRKSALNLLRSLLTNSRFRQCCSELMGTYLNRKEAHKDQENIIQILYRLTAADDLNPTPSDQESSDRYALLNDIISPHISLLLKLTLLVGDRTHQGELRKHAEHILLENLKNYPGGPTLIEDVLSAIPSMVPTIPPEGKTIAVRIVDALPVQSKGRALSIAHALVPFLRDPSPFARATALELLSRLHRQYRPELIGSATQEIIGLALTDSLDEIRITAIQLLSALAAPSQERNDQKLPAITPSIQLAERFIPLLQSEALRPSIVELLSAMAKSPPVRRALSLRIMTSSFGPDSASVSLEAHTELLSRLISDGRFLDGVDEATDKVMLFFAPVLVAKPELARYRFEILTALWCHYSTASLVNVRAPLPTVPVTSIKPTASAPPIASASPTAPKSSTEEGGVRLEPSDESTTKLVEWFTFATFGRHATQDEVKKCSTRSALWLPKLTPENLESEVLRCLPYDPLSS